MNEKALRILEFDKLIDRLIHMAGSVPGKELCRRLVPADDLFVINQMLGETGDALRRIYQKGSLSFAGTVDLTASIKRLEIGSAMSASELLQICSLLDAASRAKAYARTPADERSSEPSSEDPENTQQPEAVLDPLFAGISPLSSVSAEIRRCILSEEEIADDASPKLRQIRRTMSQTYERIRSQLNGMVNGSARMYLQDAVITQRNGRFCVPVKAECRSQVPGMIHDQSSSGSTLFIEPMAVVRLNNELRELELEEKKEIDAILASLSNSVAAESNAILQNISILTRLDFIFARAMLAKSYNGYMPEFNEDGIIDIRKARHPLLDPKKVVPVDIRLGEDFDLLVISGPNTGGKTVSLKTAGLFTLMGQAGLFIPAAEHSRLAVFKEVYADIGDEQSIEQSLSTFSSHMTNIVAFWEKADEHSLVLFDELGAGTDPTEGAALAIAILSNLHSRGIRTIATTHYSELKIFALSTPGVENACCEFNVETLRPTYRLLIGIPGKSNAFAISRRLGLPDEVIEQAKEHIGQEEEKFEDVVADLENRRMQTESDLAAAQQLKDEAQQLRSRYEQRQNRLDESREKILSQAREEAAAILRDAKEYADETIRRYNKMGGFSSSREMEQERTRLREKINELDAGKKEKKRSSNTGGIDPSKIRIGDSVRSISLGKTVTVSSLPDSKGNLFVHMGLLRTQVNISDLEPSMEAAAEQSAARKTAPRSVAGQIKVGKSASVSMEINLLGKTTDEAIPELDKYLDDVCVAHLETVRVVHGKGTGALRKAVHNYLRRQKRVASFRLGEYGEGDSGVTIVTLRY